MKKIIVLALAVALPLTLSACFLFGGAKDETVTTDTSESPLVGVWMQTEKGFHGNAIYVWSFGEDGRFTYLFSAYEPPQGGGGIDSSVRERFMQGNYRQNGNTVECYNVRLDDYFSWGDKWRYFSVRTPEVFAMQIMITPLKEAVKTDDFSFEFTKREDVNKGEHLKIKLDLGELPDQYEMEFDRIFYPVGINDIPHQ